MAGAEPRDPSPTAPQANGGVGGEDAALVLAAGQGDRAAFRRLMDRHARGAVMLAQRMLGNPDDADEVVQEAFLRVWTAAPRWRADGGATFKTWLHRIVANLCVDRLRRVRPVALEDGDGYDEHPDPSPDALAQRVEAERGTMLAQALSALPERQQQALRLYYYEDLTAPQAAASLEMSVSAFESLLVRGRKHLREVLRKAGLTQREDLG